MGIFHRSTAIRKMTTPLKLGNITFKDGKDYHGGAGEGKCSKETIRTQLIKAYEEQKKQAWNKFEKGKYTKSGVNRNFDFHFHKDGEVHVKPAGERGDGTSTGIMWKDLPVMEKAFKEGLFNWTGKDDAKP